MTVGGISNFNRHLPLALRRSIFAFLFVLQFFVLDAFGAEKLSVDLMPLGTRPRNQAPIPVEARFKWESTRILEGRLDMSFYEGNRLLGRYRSGDVTLAGGEQRFHMLLPPSLAPFSDSQIEVRMKFVTAHVVMDLDPSSVFVPIDRERSLVVCWCDASTAGGGMPAEIMQSLRLEHFAPPTDPVAQRLLMTSFARVAPEDLPAQPLGYTAFDVVILTAEGFKQTGERQLQALARWVRGGGSVCIFVPGGLHPHHLEFLNQLKDSASGPTFFANDSGNLVPALKGISCFRSGLGRTAVVAANAVGTLDTSDWEGTSLFLWKFRSSQIQAIASSKHWEVPADTDAGNNPYPRVRTYNDPNYGNMVYGVQQSDLGAGLMNRLMPQTVRLIPFPALIGLLGLFVVLIGPGDYFILGWLRRRRLTWLLFPILSIIFTVATVMMANHYLGLRDQRRSLIIVDLAKDGTALRWNRYQLVFAARDKQSVTELKDALWAPLDVRAVDPYNPYNSRYPYNGSYRYRGGMETEKSPPLYDGVLPVHFNAVESIRQWRPELNRSFSFEPPPVPLPSNWQAVETSLPDIAAIRSALSSSASFYGDVVVLSGTNVPVFNGVFHGILPIEILKPLCLADVGGLMSVVSQVSPAGGGNFEDVPAMDGDANDSVLVIVTRAGDDIVVYRRFFYGK